MEKLTIKQIFENMKYTGVYVRYYGRWQVGIGETQCNTASGWTFEDAFINFLKEYCDYEFDYDAFEFTFDGCYIITYENNQIYGDTMEDTILDFFEFFIGD